MNLDDRIRRELERQGADISALEVDTGGMFGMMHRVFSGSLRRWAAYGMFLTLVFFALTVWCGYGFFTAESLDQRLLWALGVVLGFHAVSMLKLWFFMEMNRNSVLREVKRVEALVLRLVEAESRTDEPGRAD